MSISWPNIMFDYSDKLWVSQRKVISAQKKKKTPNTAKNVQHSSRKKKIPFK